MEKVRILFISHSTNMVGGASQSLRNLIVNFGEKVDMIVPKDKTVRNKAIRDFYGTNINKIYRCCLPFRQSFYDKNADWKSEYCIEKNYRKNKNKIFQIIEKNDYDAIHINSCVLYPLVCKKYPMYIHVRELCIASRLTKAFIQFRFRKSHGIIYISHATKNGLGVGGKNIVLNNPFDQRKVLKVDLCDIRNKYSIQEKETVFVYIASCDTPAKGLYFVVDAFIKAKCEYAKLLIVGPEKVPGYGKRPNIIFTGIVSNMEEIYAVSDYVLRGDDAVAIGRTVYEGLYSGCSVIIPGNAERDMKNMFENGRFEEHIFFYELRDTEALVKLLRERNGKKKNAVLGLSNVDAYVRQFKKFVFGGNGR